MATSLLLSVSSCPASLEMRCVLKSASICCKAATRQCTGLNAQALQSINHHTSYGGSYCAALTTDRQAFSTHLDKHSGLHYAVVKHVVGIKERAVQRDRRIGGLGGVDRSQDELRPRYVSVLLLWSA